MWKGEAVSIGLLALLDDVAAIAKVAVASLDDVAGQAAKAGAKAAGVVIDDAAVTPRYVVGFSAARELPIVGRIAIGSLRNKLLILLPAALALSALLPSAITPLLMLGGAYLCYEGVEKIYEAVLPHHAHAHEGELGTIALSAETLEDEKVAGAIKTDFILSAEIMAITLAAVPEASFLNQALVLALVGLGITVVVYGVVAAIVKADDLGVALASSQGRGAVPEPGARTCTRPRHARLSRFSERRRHGGHDLGRRRDHRPWPRNLWPARRRRRHPCDGRGRGSRGAAGSLRGRMGGHRGRVRHRRAGDRRSLHTARRIHRRAGMEAAQARAGASRAVSLPTTTGAEPHRASQVAIDRRAADGGDGLAILRYMDAISDQAAAASSG